MLIIALSYHLVALLQALPDFMSQLSSVDEAKALVNVVRDILASPSQAEKEYLGLLLQAQFGVHLLGYDPDTLRVRSREFTKTLFLIDSTTLIPFLARSSPGHSAACLLVAKLRASGAAIATTILLAEEVAEHARWPFDAAVIEESGHYGTEFLKAARGMTGYRSNAFLEGFLAEVGMGTIPLNYLTYMESICGDRLAGTDYNETMQRALRSGGVPTIGFGEWQGFKEELWEKRDSVQTQIAERRTVNNTYRRERQVKAEAEALIAIQEVRNKSLRLDGQDFVNAYFISRTRAIDDVAGNGLRITMKPEAVLHWLATITPCSPQELTCFVNGLLWELSERGFSIVKAEELRAAFSPLVTASRDMLHEEIEHHRALISRQYGVSGELAFQQVSDMDVPIVLQSYLVQKSEELARELQSQRKLVEDAEEKAIQAGELQRQLSRERLSLERAKLETALTAKDRTELERLRADRSEKRRNNVRRKRKAASSPMKKRKKP